MYRNVLWLSVLVCLLATNAGLAQDPTKVEPKHYRLAFENERVQVIYVHYGPHEKSVMHDHPAGVVVNISDGHLKFTDQRGNVQEVSFQTRRGQMVSAVQTQGREPGGHGLRRGLHRS